LFEAKRNGAVEDFTLPSQFPTEPALIEEVSLIYDQQSSHAHLPRNSYFVAWFPARTGTSLAPG